MMNIAVACDGSSLSDMVSESFCECRYLLIVDMDTMSVKAIENQNRDNGAELARTAVKHDCEAVITGGLTSEAFDILADENITRYLGGGIEAARALALMESQGLRLIKNADGTDTCKVEHGK